MSVIDEQPQDQEKGVIASIFGYLPKSISENQQERETEPSLLVGWSNKYVMLMPPSEHKRNGESFYKTLARCMDEEVFTTNNEPSRNSSYLLNSGEKTKLARAEHIYTPPWRGSILTSLGRLGVQMYLLQTDKPENLALTTQEFSSYGWIKEEDLLNESPIVILSNSRRVIVPREARGHLYNTFDLYRTWLKTGTEPDVDNLMKRLALNNHNLYLLEDKRRLLNECYGNQKNSTPKL